MIGKKVAVGLSGGVDSAVCAWLLKQQGYEVVGVHLYCWPPKSEIERDGITREEWIKKNGCRADEDRASALKTALEIGVPFKELDFSEEYNSKVIKYFYGEYEAGRTPNPDVLCNSEIKFGLFLDWALENGFDAIATGHYAKIVNFTSFSKSSFLATDSSTSPVGVAYLHSRLENSADGGNQAFQDCENSQKNDTCKELVRLLIPKDKHKDQTYFLWKLTEKELKHVIFPLGDLLKNEVREIAKDAGLSVSNKKDSQGICFVGNVEVREFLARRLQKKTGDVVDTEGNVIGKHDGIWFYTIGQRGGWVIDPVAQKRLTLEGELKPLFILEKLAKENKLVVGERSDGLRDSFVVLEPNIREVENIGYVRIRHGGELFDVEVSFQGGTLEVETSKKVFGVASGQSAVFYSEEGECLGGGVIA